MPNKGQKPGVPQNPNRTIRHGTAVLLHNPGYAASAVFIRGGSGSGKSDLALRLIAQGAELIGDDQVELEKRQENIFAGAVEAIRGLIEVRGIGLLRYPEAAPSKLRLIVDLVAREAVPRLPEWEDMDILGVKIPMVKLHAFDASVLDKVHAAMMVVHHPKMIVK
ncbi:MAG TPA: HPr kinase/phosphatase C-terminal domain-containing protein [Alphaproteobacteria bacterium]|jgi:serine kinase of HPr protein (carbohydrate metabolism regulator)|nr:HPr kinase/phosphatase C-terminal domain-containing protein [Alphaproteobacteria bacterium]